jgi:hypothetical protein
MKRGVLINEKPNEVVRERKMFLYHTSKLISKNIKNYNIRDYNLDVAPVWVRNLVSEIGEEHRLRVFENRVLRRIFVPKRDEVTGGWRKLHNERLHNQYFSTVIIRTNK